MLLQTLAQAGDSSNLSSLAHLQATIRVFTSPSNFNELKAEITGAVKGPLLPELRARGLDIEYLRLASLQVVSPPIEHRLGNTVTVQACL